MRQTITFPRSGLAQKDKALNRAAESAMRCRQKVPSHFPAGFADAKYFARERGYKVKAREAWEKSLQHNLSDLKPRGMLDIQSFIRVLGSSEYD